MRVTLTGYTNISFPSPTPQTRTWTCNTFHIMKSFDKKILEICNTEDVYEIYIDERFVGFCDNDGYGSYGGIFLGKFDKGKWKCESEFIGGKIELHTLDYT